MQASLIGDTVLVLQGIEKYAANEQIPQVNAARTLAEQWLSHAPLRHQQDRLWRLWGLHHLDRDDVLKKRTRKAILVDQRQDGGLKPRTAKAIRTRVNAQLLLQLGTISIRCPSRLK